jgi:hypothetical protein
MTEPSRYVVDKADEPGTGWVLRHQTGGPALSTHRTKAEAVDRAAALLGDCPGGGELLALNTRTRELEARRILGHGATDGSVDATAAVGFTETVSREGEQIDNVLVLVLPVAAAFGAAVVSPDVAAADGWLAVFLATLAWSGGWALSTYALAKGVVGGVQAIFAVAGCFVASLTIANWLGVGMLDIAGPGSGAPAGLLAWLADFTGAALMTYGWFGALIGAGVGLWLGYRFSQHAT